MNNDRGLWVRAVGAAAVTLLAACSGQRAEPEVNPANQVAIGYDRVDSRELTGSISSLQGEDLEAMKVSRVEEMIRDRIPGVVVTRLRNGDYSFRIRGARSLVGSNEPLVVIDGMPLSPSSMTTALANIAPSDVLRIDVLKDAGSTSAYGSRGANGVIVITTRSYNRY